jgi:hypothetical protein
MTTWFSFLLILLPFFLVSGLKAFSDTGEMENLGFLIVPPAMIAFGIAFLNFGQRSWQDDKARLEHFLATSLSQHVR